MWQVLKFRSSSVVVVVVVSPWSSLHVFCCNMCQHPTLILKAPALVEEVVGVRS